MKKRTVDTAELLREHGFRATPGRLALLELFAESKQPLTVADIHKRMRNGMNEVTLYRAIEALVAAGICRRIDLHQGHAVHYELAEEHHHHLVCTNCGTIEDFSSQLCDELAAKATKASHQFKTILTHSLELFGLCNRCA